MPVSPRASAAHHRSADRLSARRRTSADVPAPAPTRRRALGRRVRRLAALGAALAVSATALAGCAGEGSGNANPEQGGGSKTLNIDYATYNPLSLIIKDKGWLEDSLKDQGVKVNWVQSTGSNKANEGLRAGALDFGSTAGSAALLNRANGSPIKVVTVANQPEWSAIVTRPGSDIREAEDLKGKKIAATKGTDPYFFLLQTLGSAGLKPTDVTVENIQHADGRSALDDGSVDAWAGLDPIMGAAQKDGDRLAIRHVDYNTYDLIAAREDYLQQSPETSQAVVDAYEKARAWAKKHPAETAQILAKDAGIDPSVAKTVIQDRTNVDVSGEPGEKQTKVLRRVGRFLVDSGDVPDQKSVDEGLSQLLDPSLEQKADPSRVKGE